MAVSLGYSLTAPSGEGSEFGSALWFDASENLCHTAARVFASMRRFALPALIRDCLRLSCLLVCWSVATLAQGGGPTTDSGLRDNTLLYTTAPGTGIVVATVYSEKKGALLDRQALLELLNRSTQAATWQTTSEMLQGAFQDHVSQGAFTNVAYGEYDIEVSAVGYLSERRQLQVVNSWSPIELKFALKRDPEAVNLDVPDVVISAKARKEVKRGVSALKSNNLKEAEKQLGAAYSSDPSSSDVNFLLGYLYYQKRDFGRAADYLRAAANINPRNKQALTLLGRAGLQQKDYPAARSALEKAVLADADNWQPHDLLADAYLHQRNFDRARDEARVAIEKGKAHASAAQLVLGEALVSLGDDKAGVEALNKFLEESPLHPMAGQVRGLIAEVEEHASNPAATARAERGPTKLIGVDPLEALGAPMLSSNSWQPPGIDDIKLNIAAGAICPSEKVIEESGKRVQELVEDVTRFAAVEDLFHQRLDAYGLPVRTETRKYNYVASISEQEPGYLSVDEYRADKLELAGYPDQIASTGFAALALVFHPHMRDNFEMKCEGLGDWRGQPSWLVRFQQRADRPSRIHSYKVGTQSHPVNLKGRAWITAGKFQIVRIEAELVSPMPEIQLLSEHQIVEYGPVPFARKNTTLWLPKSAEIYFDFRGHRYYRRHSFDHYMLFAVDSDEKRKEPQNKPAHEPSVNEAKKSP
jgi:tetratricopeptide (TPR) repeat protein